MGVIVISRIERWEGRGLNKEGARRRERDRKGRHARRDSTIGNIKSAKERRFCAARATVTHDGG